MYYISFVIFDTRRLGWKLNICITTLLVLAPYFSRKAFLSLFVFHGYRIIFAKRLELSLSSCFINSRVEQTKETKKSQDVLFLLTSVFLFSTWDSREILFFHSKEPKQIFNDRIL